MKLIDKDAVVAEIEKKRNAALTRQRNLEAIGQVTVLNETLARELNRIISFINTLEVKEVNLEKEQIISNTADAMIGLPYENKYGGYTHLIDVLRPLPVGNNKIAIIFKED